MFYPNTPQFVQPGVGVASPAGWCGPDVPDGDAAPWITAPVGSEYIYVVEDTHIAKYVKVKDDSRDDDWCIVSGVISERFVLADFTDGGGTSGTVVMATQLPVGALPLRATAVNVTGFSGDTTANCQIGDGSDADRFAAGGSVAATIAAVYLGAPTSTVPAATATSLTVTITGLSDFTSISAGAMTIRIFYTA